MESALADQKKHLHVDKPGYELFGDDDQDWLLRVAFEHENNHKSWRSELCKLCHITADLRVLMSYHNFKKKGGPSIDVELQRALQQLKKHNRVTRWQGDWFFIFGPHRIGPRMRRHPFVAFTLSSDGKPLPIDEADGEKLYPPEF